MNSLGRTIERNEVVVLKKSIFKPKYQNLKYRLFQITSGYGMSMFTGGTALYGRYLEDNEATRENSMDIDKNETWEHQEGLK